MAFKLQGKDMNYLDMKQFLESVKNEQVLERLEEREVSSFLERLLAWQNEEFIRMIELNDHNVNFFAEALLSKQIFREKGRTLIRKSNEEVENIKNQLINFIHVDFVHML